MSKTINFPTDRIMKGTHAFYPEMKERKVECQIEASLGYYGSHYFIDTTLELKGRGITYIKTYTSSDLTSHGQRKVGWHSYKVTTKAYSKLEKEYSISREVLLD